jgi:hypothetical protein
MLSRVFFLIFFSCFFGTLSAQVTHHDLVQDTIIYRTSFLNRTYLLNGKPLTLPVMAFFMKDYPSANNEIRLAQFSDQFCITGYSIGSLFTIGGLLISRQNKDLGDDLIKLGLAGIGAGLIFQVVSGNFKYKAVQNYNEEIKKIYLKNTSSIRFKAGINQAGLVVGFD